MPVGLQLNDVEAADLWASWCRSVGCVQLIDDGLCHYAFSLTDRQPGLLAHVLDWLRDMGLANKPPQLQADFIKQQLLSPNFMDSLSSVRSILR